ncbi:MAG TPA: 50S ribosomal protein L23 [Anaerolineales bacterium]|nr:50S ribosomal protein L23 [Anaerolineales bacterium]
MLTMYDVILRPVVTEKSNYQNGKLHQYVFRVHNEATKTQIKDAVEKLFNVTVTRVNVAVMPAKSGRRMRRLVVRKAPYKKAVVWLKEGDSIAEFEGVK